MVRLVNIGLEARLNNEGIKIRAVLGYFALRLRVDLWSSSARVKVGIGQIQVSIMFRYRLASCSTLLALWRTLTSPLWTPITSHIISTTVTMKRNDKKEKNKIRKHLVND